MCVLTVQNWKLLLSFSLAWLDFSQICEVQLQEKKHDVSIPSIFLPGLNFDKMRYFILNSKYAVMG